MYNDELYHHGVKGQRWGRRRYQNYDGSLTEEGYQHWGLNPDGSRFKKGYNRPYSLNAEKKSRQGMAIGMAVGAAAGALGGPALAGTAALVGSLSGAMIGTIGGEIQSASKRRKIRKLLDETGKVYVKDL